MQKGDVEYYRGVKMDVKLLPKVKIEIVVSKIPVDLVVETARRVLYTGQYGDGKIFVYEVENAVKIRTGEDGAAALQMCRKRRKDGCRQNAARHFFNKQYKNSCNRGHRLTKSPFRPSSRSGLSVCRKSFAFSQTEA